MLAKLGLAGPGAVVAGAAVRVWDDMLTTHATPETLASTVAPANVRGGARLWWSGPAQGRGVALTFDDGPTEQFTAHVLDALDAAGVRATFFVIGPSSSGTPTSSGAPWTRVTRSRTTARTT